MPAFMPLPMNADSQLNDQTGYLKQFIEEYSSSHENNKPVYLEKLTALGAWAKIGLIFGYADNMSGCQNEMVQLMKQKNWRADYRCTFVN